MAHGARHDVSDAQGRKINNLEHGRATAAGESERVPPCTVLATAARDRYPRA